MSSSGAKIISFCLNSELRHHLYRIIVVAVAGFLTYCKTLKMGFSFDDAANILNNPEVLEFSRSGLSSTLFASRPFGIFTFQINYMLSGSNVVSYHLTNLFIHLSAAILVYLILYRLMQTPYWRERSDKNIGLLPIPFFAALLFAVHPIQTQAVTYIAQRFTSLATMLYLATVLFYLNARLKQGPEAQSPNGKAALWFTASLLAAALAILTKEIAYTIPLALLMVELLFFGFELKKVVRLGGAFLFISVFLLVKLGLGKVPLEQALFKVDAATRVQTIISRSDYLITQFRVIVTYLRLLFLPVNQSVDYDYTLSHSFFDPGVASSFALLVLLFVMAIWLLSRSRKGDPHQRLIAFGILWFFLTLSIESSLFPIIDLIFEHRVYLPSFGAITAITTIILYIAWQAGEVIRKDFVCLGLLLIVLIFSCVSWKRNLVWTNEVTLWEDATSKKPLNGRAWNNLGGAYIKQNEPDKALKALIRSAELDPSKAAAWNNIGIAIDMKGVYRDRFNKTTEMFANPKAVEDVVVRRWLGDVNNNLGLAYEITGNLPKAAEYYRNAVGYYPALGVAYFNLGIVSAAMGDWGKYSEQLQILWLVDPPLAERLQLRIGRK